MGAEVEEPAWHTLRGSLQCELPNANLHVFKGRFDLHVSGAPQSTPLSCDCIRRQCCIPLCQRASPALTPARSPTTISEVELSKDSIGTSFGSTPRPC